MDDPSTFLSRLIGNWNLTGMMGSIPLQQKVEARWGLGHSYVEMRCTSTLVAAGGARYEALYLVGYHAPSDQYVLHLFDTFGVALHPTPGIGRCAGNSIPFVFQYEQGPFVNRFTWHEETDSWDHDLVDESGEEHKVFATKHLTRAAE